MYRLQKGTSDTILTTHLEEHGIHIRSIELKSNPEAKYDSFRIEIRVSDMSKVLDPNMWPTGINVRRFIKPRAVTEQ